MSRKGKRLDSHHCIPRSRCQGLDFHDNEALVLQSFHRGLHQAFRNKLPHEILYKVIRLNEKVLDPYFVRLMIELLTSESVYRKDISFTLHIWNIGGG